MIRPSCGERSLLRPFRYPTPSVGLLFRVKYGTSHNPHTRICGRQSMGSILSRAQKSRDRCRLRSWLYHHIDALGGLRRFYVPSAPSTLAPKERILLMRHRVETACCTHFRTRNGLALKRELCRELHQARSRGANDLAKIGVFHLPSHRRGTIELRVVEGIEPLQAEFE